MSPFCAQLSFLSSEKHVFRTGVSGRKFNSQSSFFLHLFPSNGSFELCVGGKKKRYLCFLFTLLFWKALLRRSSLCTQLSSFPLVIACVWLVLPEFLIFGVQMNLRSHCYAAQNAWGFIWLHEEATENREIFLISAQDCPSVASGPRCVQLSWGSQSFLPPSVIAGNSRDFCKIEK